jgi:hypothetical protein
MGRELEDAEMESMWTWREVVPGQAVIMQYQHGPGGHVVVPSRLGGLPVTAIFSDAFYYSTGVTGVTLPVTVRSLDGGPMVAGYRGFWRCQVPVVMADE